MNRYKSNVKPLSQLIEEGWAFHINQGDVVLHKGTGTIVASQFSLLGTRQLTTHKLPASALVEPAIVDHSNVSEKDELLGVIHFYPDGGAWIGRLGVFLSAPELLKIKETLIVSGKIDETTQSAETLKDLSEFVAGNKTSEPAQQVTN